MDGNGSLITKEWLNTGEAAAYLGIPVGTLRNLTSNGQIPYYKVPGTRLNRYSVTELRDLLFKNKRGGSNGN